jgi:hypothetical protein
LDGDQSAKDQGPHTSDCQCAIRPVPDHGRSLARREHGHMSDR